MWTLSLKWGLFTKTPPCAGLPRKALYTGDLECGFSILYVMLLLVNLLCVPPPLSTSTRFIPLVLQCQPIDRLYIERVVN